MITLARFKTEQIMPFIGMDKPSIQLNGFNVKTSSTRLECFKRQQKCTTCECRGSVWLLQSHVMVVIHRTNCFISNCEWCCHHPHIKHQVEAPHLNFYHVGKHGGLMLMTQDHIIPRSRGGSNKIDNLQTMCLRCNQWKANKFP